MVLRRLLAAILSLPYPWFDFSCDHLYAVHDAHQFSISGPTQCERCKQFSFRIYRGIDDSPCCSLSSSLRSKGLALFGKRSPCPLAQACTHNCTMICTRRIYICIKSTVSLKDSNGQQVYSAPTTVQDGGDSRYGDIGNLWSFFHDFLKPSCVNRDVKEGKEASTSGSATK